LINIIKKTFILK